MIAGMQGGWTRIGEVSWLLEHGAEAPIPAELLAVPGVVETWRTAFGTAISTDLASFDLASLDSVPRSEALGRSGRVLTVPVDYSRGEDLTEAAHVLGVDPDQVVECHSGAEYVCVSVGFAPGFAYLSPLVEPLSRLNRRPSPRPRVEPGKVAVALGSTGVYPKGTPGGWWLLGQTPAIVCDWRTGYFGIEIGDTVRFLPISTEEFDQMVGKRLCDV